MILWSFHVPYDNISVMLLFKVCVMISYVDFQNVDSKIPELRQLFLSKYEGNYGIYHDTIIWY